MWFWQWQRELGWPQFGLGFGEGLATSLILGFGGLWGYKQLTGRSLRPGRPASCLQLDETRIHDRLEALKQRQEPIVILRRRAMKILDPQRRETLLTSLEQALDILQEQRERYHIKLWEITLLRWYNQVEPLALQVQTQAAKRVPPGDTLDQLEAVISQGQGFLGQWSQSPLGQRPAGEASLDRLRSVLDACDALYQDLLALQASQILQGISRFDWASRSPLQTPQMESLLDVLGELPSVSEFNQGFEQLEQEYLRLQSEAELEGESGVNLSP